MPKYLDQTGLTTFKSKLDTTYAKKNDVYDKTAADGLLSAKANSADVYTKAQVDSAIAGVGLPTITIAPSQVISQDPLQIQLTNEQYQILANNKQVILDASALGMGAVVGVFNGSYESDGVNYLDFTFSYHSDDTHVNFSKIIVNTSTKVGESSVVFVSYADRAENATNATRAETSDFAVSAGLANSTDFIRYSTTAPSSVGASYLRIVVLSSEPAKRYDGYLYIITESN